VNYAGGYQGFRNEATPRAIVQGVRDLTKRVMDATELDTKTRNDAEFLLRLYSTMLNLGNRDRESEIHGRAGRYSFGKRGFDRCD